MTRWATLVAALLAASPAGAQCLGFQCPPGVLGAAASGTSPPLNGFTTLAAAYSFRLLLSAYLGTGAAVRIRRASDNAEIDVGFAGDGGFDQAAAAAHCAATTCFLRTWYDQSGNARHLTQATAASQPLLVLGCQNFLACLRTTGTQQMAGPSNTPVSPVSLNSVQRRTSGTGTCFYRTSGATSNQIAARSGSAGISIAGSAGTIVNSAAEGSWHSSSGVINAASSTLTTDGSQVTGSVTAAVTAGIIGFFGTAVAQCDWVEVVYWSGYALTPAEISALTANQRSFWGF